MRYEIQFSDFIGHLRGCYFVTTFYNGDSVDSGFMTTTRPTKRMIRDMAKYTNIRAMQVYRRASKCDRHA